MIRRIDNIAFRDEVAVELVGSDGGIDFALANAAWRKTWQIAKQGKENECQ